MRGIGCCCRWLQSRRNTKRHTGVRSSSNLQRHPVIALRLTHSIVNRTFQDERNINRRSPVSCSRKGSPPLEVFSGENTRTFISRRNDRVSKRSPRDELLTSLRLALHFSGHPKLARNRHAQPETRLEISWIASSQVSSPICRTSSHFAARRGCFLLRRVMSVC